MGKTLYITSGDSSGEGLVKSGLAGEVFVWHDILYDGPRCSGCPAPQLTFRSLRHKNLKTAQPDNLKII